MPGGPSLFLFRAWMFGPRKQQEDFLDEAGRSVVFSGKCPGWSRWLRPQVWVSGLGQWFSNCLLGCITDSLAPEGLPEVGPGAPGDSNV